MARKRMIDPKIWDSEQVMSLSPFEFKIYIFLISSADDEGRLKISYPIFKARIYPTEHFNGHFYRVGRGLGAKSGLISAQSGKVVNAIQGALFRMHDIELIDIYTDGKHEYVQHPNWKIYQKIDKPRSSILPSKCDCESAKSSRTVDEESANNRVGVDPNRIEKNRIEKNRIEQEANEKRKPKAAPPTASPSEVNSPPQKEVSKTKDQQLIEAANLLREENPAEYQQFIKKHPELIIKGFQNNDVWEVT